MFHVTPLFSPNFYFPKKILKQNQKNFKWQIRNLENNPGEYRSWREVVLMDQQMRKGGLEPPHPKAPDPKSSVSANST
ncbi:MAG: hypothetical protein KAT17_10125, partial [Candidatus Aminicenantes bacterium]|nr:hypothetical protein [Candidatus Aminicenantes bacterium]